MKKQINPSIKAQLLRSALIVFSLVAICAISIGLGQRNPAKQNVVRSVANQNAADSVHSPLANAPAPKSGGAKLTMRSKFPRKTNDPTGIASPPILPYPKAPQVVLYDQYSNPGAFATVSSTFTDSPANNADLADDFVVPAGQTWSVQSIDADGFYLNVTGPANSFNVFFYSNSGSVPGAPVYSVTNQPWTQLGTTFTVNLPTPAVLTPGTYWVEIQANMTFLTGSEWGWTHRTIATNNPASWQNPAGGFGPPPSCPAPGCPTPCPNCITWGIRQCCTGGVPGEPDQMFRLVGTLGSATPTPSATGTPNPTATATPTATGTPSPTPTGTPSPSATATPTGTGTPIPTPGSCISYEAEDNTLTGSAVPLNCPTCSGGVKVGFVGNNFGTLQFDNVSANAEGRYSMTICYTNGDAVRYALLSVNGGQGTPLSFPSTGSFQTVGSIQTTITLHAGSDNTLLFYNPIVGRWAPDFDRIQFNCPTCAAATLGNLSTRSRVQTGDDVMIGGFIVRGGGTKRVVLRAIGPELTQYGVPDPLQNPTLEVHDGTGALIASNNDWQHTIIGGIITSDQVRKIQNTGHAPADPRESAIVADLSPGNYTAIVRGQNNTVGAALVEVYDLNLFNGSFLGNISTRSFVQTGDNVMIGGFIVQGSQSSNVIIRAIGPELSQHGVANPLADPTLELHNDTGAVIGSNDNWQRTIIGGIITSNQVQDIQNSGYAPRDPRESAIIATLPPGNYTAIVRGVNSTTGIALVEVYDLH